MNARQAVLALMIVSTVGIIAANVTASDVEFDNDPEINETAMQAAFVGTINDARADADVSELAYSQRIHDDSTEWANHLATNGQLVHGEPNCAPGGENIAQTWFDESIETDRGLIHYDSGAELGAGLAEQWLTSESHRENIMNPRFTDTAVGVSVVNDRGKTKVYAVQRLCS